MMREKEDKKEHQMIIEADREEHKEEREFSSDCKYNIIGWAMNSAVIESAMEEDR